MPYSLVSFPVLIYLGRFAHAIYSDRRSQLISSSSRVVPSYAGITLRIDDEMRPTEEDQDDLSTLYGLPDTIGNDPDNEGHRGVPIPRPSNVNVKRVEHYRSFGGQVKVDERSPLLPCLSGEAPSQIVLRHQSGPTKSASVVIGQSTFSQTVSGVAFCL